MTAPRKTKRNVDLVSSHDDEDNDGPSLICDDEPTGLEIPHSSTGLGGPTLRFRPLKPGEPSIL